MTGRMMNKREFLKASGAGIVAAAAVAAPAAASLPRRRIAVVQLGIDGAASFIAAQRAGGSQVMIPTGDPVRWFRDTLRPALTGAEVIGLTDGAHALILEGSLREAGYRRTTSPAPIGRATLWSAIPRV
jgi:hypothetical protein